MPVHHHWCLASLYFAYFAVVGGLVPYWGLYLKQLGFGEADIGLLLALPMLTKILVPNLWGWLADYTGAYHRVVQAGALGACLAFVVLLVAERFWPLALAMALYSAFWNAILPQIEALTLSSLAGQTQLYSRIRLWGSVGFIAAVLGLGALFEHYSLRHLPLVLLLGLAATLLLSLALPASPKRTQHEPSPPLWHILKQPPVLALLVATLAFQMSHGIYYGFYSIHLTQEGYSTGAIGVLWTLGVLAEILLFWWLPGVLPRLDVQRVLVACLWIGAVRWALIDLCAKSFAILLILQLLHAFTFALFHALSIELLRRYFGPALQGRGQALYGALGYGLGGALGLWITGWCWSLSPHWAFGFAVVSAAVAAGVAQKGFRRQP